MPEKKDEEKPVTCPHVHVKGQETPGPCPLCLEIERMLRDGEVPY